MAEIAISIESNLLIVSVVGQLTAYEIITVVKKYYPSGVVKDIIWDITNGSLGAIPMEGFRQIADATLKALAAGARQNGRTIYVASSAPNYGLSRMYSTIAELSGIPIEYSVFNTIEEAMLWLAPKRC